MEELGNVLMLLTIFECISYIMSVDVMVVIILTGKHALTWKNQGILTWKIAFYMYSAFKHWLFLFSYQALGF